MGAMAKPWLDTMAKLEMGAMAKLDEVERRHAPGQATPGQSP